MLKKKSSYFPEITCPGKRIINLLHETIRMPAARFAAYRTELCAK